MTVWATIEASPEVFKVGDPAVGTAFLASGHGFVKPRWVRTPGRTTSHELSIMATLAAEMVTGELRAEVLPLVLLAAVYPTSTRKARPRRTASKPDTEWLVLAGLHSRDKHGRLVPRRRMRYERPPR